MSWNVWGVTGELPPPITSSPQLKFFTCVPSMFDAWPQMPVPAPFANENCVGVSGPQSHAGGTGASFRFSCAAVLDVSSPPKSAR